MKKIKIVGRKMKRKCLGFIYIFPLPLFNIFLMKNLNLKMYELLNKFILICVHFYFHDKQKEGNWGCFLLFFSLPATFNIQMEIKCDLISIEKLIE